MPHTSVKTRHWEQKLSVSASMAFHRKESQGLRHAPQKRGSRSSESAEEAADDGALGARLSG